MEQLNVDVIERLTRLAFEFGPFLFAILCLVFITWRAHGYYSKASTNPALPSSVVRTHTIVYLGAWLLSGLLVVAACSWWFTNYTEINVHSFEIRGLNESEYVTSPEEFMYTRARRQSADAPINVTKDVVFAVITGKKLEDISPFRVRYLNTVTKTWTEFEVPYGEDQNFKIVEGKLTVASGESRPLPRRRLNAEHMGRIILAQFSEKTTSRDLRKTTDRYQWKSPKYDSRLKTEGKSMESDNHDKSLKLDPSEKYQIIQQIQTRRNIPY